jgi:hypothetical protein
MIVLLMLMHLGTRRMLLMTTPLLNSSSTFNAYRVTLADGRATSVGAVIDEARRTRGKAIAASFCAMVKLCRRGRIQLAALLAPALGRTRQLRYLP